MLTPTSARRARTPPNGSAPATALASLRPQPSLQALQARQSTATTTAAASSISTLASFATPRTVPHRRGAPTPTTLEQVLSAQIGNAAVRAARALKAGALGSALDDLAHINTWWGNAQPGLEKLHALLDDDDAVQVVARYEGASGQTVRAALHQARISKVDLRAALDKREAVRARSAGSVRKANIEKTVEMFTSGCFSLTDARIRHEACEADVVLDAHDGLDVFDDGARRGRRSDLQLAVADVRRERDDVVDRALAGARQSEVGHRDAEAVHQLEQLALHLDRRVDDRRALDAVPQRLVKELHAPGEDATGALVLVPVEDDAVCEAFVSRLHRASPRAGDVAFLGTRSVTSSPTASTQRIQISSRSSRAQRRARTEQNVERAGSWAPPNTVTAENLTAPR